MIRDDARGATMVQESGAYRAGWTDGRFDSSERPVEEASGWVPEGDLPAYHRGYQEGRRVREMLGLRA